MKKMKISTGYMLREIAGHYVVLPIGSKVVEFTGVITLNETGAFLWKSMESDITEAELIEKMTAEYAIDEATAKQDISEFLTTMRDNKLLLGE